MAKLIEIKKAVPEVTSAIFEFTSEEIAYILACLGPYNSSYFSKDKEWMHVYSVLDQCIPFSEVEKARTIRRDNYHDPVKRRDV